MPSKKELIAATQERTVVSSEPQEDGKSYLVTLSCGHTAIWFVKPYVTKTPCAICVNELIAKHNQETA
jgi:hypothetical protein